MNWRYQCWFYSHPHSGGTVLSSDTLQRRGRDVWDRYTVLLKPLSSSGLPCQGPFGPPHGIWLDQLRHCR